MKTNPKLFSRLFWVASMGLAAMLTTTTPSSNAQEVNPTHFTATGVEDEYSMQKPQPKKTTVVKTSVQSTPRVSGTVAALQREKKSATADRSNSIAAGQTLGTRADAKRAARRVSVKKSGEPSRE